MNPKADWYFEKNEKWAKEIKKLRAIALDCGVNEELKWGCPCYTYNGANIFLIHVFRDYCAYLFFKGALLNDPDGILVQQTKNVQSARQIRFTNAAAIGKMERVLKTYIYEAIEAEKAGLKVKLKQTSQFDMPEEFRNKLEKSATLKKAFEALTPGRQRGYLLYFSSAKQARTREDRIKKYTRHILSGKGLEDQ